MSAGKLRWRSKKDYAFQSVTGELSIEEGKLMFAPTVPERREVQHVAQGVTLPPLPATVRAHFHLDTDQQGFAVWTLTSVRPSQERRRRTPIYLCGTVKSVHPWGLKLSLNLEEGQKVLHLKAPWNSLPETAAGERVILHAHIHTEVDWRVRVHHLFRVDDL